MVLSPEKKNVQNAIVFSTYAESTLNDTHLAYRCTLVPALFIFIFIFISLQIDEGLRKIERAYINFNKTLHRFDCMLAIDSPSATRPFSPNGTCDDCKVLFLKFFLRQLSKFVIKNIFSKNMAHRIFNFAFKYKFYKKICS